MFEIAATRDHETRCDNPHPASLVRFRESPFRNRTAGDRARSRGWIPYPGRDVRSGPRGVASGRGMPAFRRGTMGGDEYRNFSEEAPFGPSSLENVVHPPCPTFVARSGAPSAREPRQPRHQEGRRGRRPLLHIPPMTQLAEPSEHETPAVGGIDCAIRCATRHVLPRSASTEGKTRAGTIEVIVPAARLVLLPIRTRAIRPSRSRGAPARRRRRCARRGRSGRRRGGWCARRARRSGGRASP